MDWILDLAQRFTPAEGLLILVTSVYTAVTVALAVSARRQRRDNIQANLVVRLEYNDTVNLDVEVVNAGPGHAREVQAELRFLPADSDTPVRVARFGLPVMLSGETKRTWQDESSYSRIEARLAWTDPARTLKPDPYIIDVEAFRQSVQEAQLHAEVAPGDEVLHWLAQKRPYFDKILTREAFPTSLPTTDQTPDMAWAHVVASKVRQHVRRWLLVMTHLLPHRLGGPFAHWVARRSSSGYASRSGTRTRRRSRSHSKAEGAPSSRTTRDDS